jgi:DNA-binding NarL/FixJ family response regulator
VRVSAAGDALLAPEVTRRVIARFAAGSSADASGSPVTMGAATGQIATGEHHSPAAKPELTERETEVLQLVAEALSNAEIAERLYIGEATVKTHVSNLLQKLGARDRVAAVVYAHRHGLASG